MRALLQAEGAWMLGEALLVQPVAAPAQHEAWVALPHGEPAEADRGQRAASLGACAARHRGFIPPCWQQTAGCARAAAVVRCGPWRSRGGAAYAGGTRVRVPTPLSESHLASSGVAR